MKLTSLLSVKLTPNEGPKPGTNGTPRTDPEFVRTSLMRYWRRDRMSDWQFRIWEFTSKVKHLFGRHTYVPSERWDFNEETGEAMVGFEGVVCWLCDARIG